jgi:4-hydroxy-3-methylbut-2-enyl diphosphate reductase
MLERSGRRVVDGTCPFVSRIHKLVKEAGEAGKEVLIAGDPDHPEVQGITGWTDGEVQVVKTAKELEENSGKTSKTEILVAQTTFNKKKFEDIVEIFEKKKYSGCVVNTVCNATDERQTEACEIAQKVDAMVVIGGRHSSNTQKLYEICSGKCKNTYFIETLVDLDPRPFQSFSRVGITAGASTPNSIIEEVIDYVRNEL